MLGSLTFILSWLETLLFFGLSLLVLYWFYRLWKKTEESGFFWLMMSFGASPLLFTVFYRLYKLLIPGGTTPTTGGLFHPLYFVYVFSIFTLTCMTFGCLFMGLKQLGKRYALLQPPLFTDAGENQEKETS